MALRTSLRFGAGLLGAVTLVLAACAPQKSNSLVRQ